MANATKTGAAYYPAFLDLRGKDCLVVGGGAVARRKALALARCGAKVRAVAPDFSPAFRRMRGVAFRRKPFDARDLKNARLVVAATDREDLNEAISRLCRRRGLWVNVVDRPALCDFILPAVVRRGRIVFAVSTGGASPALARFIGRRLRRFFGPEYGALAAQLRRWRPALLKQPMATRKRALARLLSERGVADFRRKGARLLEKFLSLKRR